MVPVLSMLLCLIVIRRIPSSLSILEQKRHDTQFSQYIKSTKVINTALLTLTHVIFKVYGGNKMRVLLLSPYPIEKLSVKR